jgi:hypothetical protein
LVRLNLIAFFLFTGSLLAQVPPSASQKSPSVAATQATTTQESSAPAATQKTGFPFDNFKEFSAVMVGSVQPEDDREGHIYRSGDLLRTEGAEGHGYYIMDLKVFMTYGLSSMGCMRDKHMYFRAFPFSASRPGRKSERVAVGTETVDGHPCHVEDVTVSGPDLARPLKFKFWEADDLEGFPIQVQLVKGLGGAKVGGATIKYKNVVLSPPDPTLFIHQKSCHGDLPQPESATPMHPAPKKPTGAMPSAKAPSAMPPADKPQN